MQPQSHVTKFFDDYSPTYFDRYQNRDQEGHSFRARKNLVLGIMHQLPTGAAVADIGCGPGVMLKELLDQSFTVVGTDIAPGMIEECRKRFQNNSHLHLEVCPAEKIPLAGDWLDGILAMGLVEYLEDDAAVLKEFHRILKPGGIAAISLPHYWCPSRTWDRLTKWILRPFVLLLRRSKGSAPSGVRHREYHVGHYTSLGKSVGFEVVDVAFYNMKVLLRPLDKFFPTLAVRLSEQLERFARTPFLRRLGTGVIIVLKKK